MSPPFFQIDHVTPTQLILLKPTDANWIAKRAVRQLPKFCKRPALVEGITLAVTCELGLLGFVVAHGCFALIPRTTFSSADCFFSQALIIERAVSFCVFARSENSPLFGQLITRRINNRAAMPSLDPLFGSRTECLYAL